MKTWTGVIGLLLMATAPGVAEMRTWTFEKSGKTVEGEVIGFAGDAVSLKRPDGKIFSVPIAYLVASNRTQLATERAKKWKDVEVLMLEGTASAGRYKRCTVGGKDVQGKILIDLLPSSVEAILINRSQQAARIEQLKSWIENTSEALGPERNPLSGTNAAGLYDPYAAVFYVRDPARVRLDDARANLTKLQAAYTDYIAQTKAATVLKMKNTGLIYEGLPVWECFDPRKRQQ